MKAAILVATPRVTLRSATPRPYDGAIAAARTCYAPRVVPVDEVTESQRSSIGPLTFEAGHHTVYQHAHFEFGLEQVSRQFVWSFLHAHPFYNSEQSSQRYVRLDEIRAHVPPALDMPARQVYERAVSEAWQAYAEIASLLRVDALRILSDLRHLSSKASERRRRRVEREAERKAIEAARYVIPVAACTSLVHTISGIVLHRLLRMVRSGDVPSENAVVVGAMVDCVRTIDPDFFDRIGDGPLAPEGIIERGFPPATGGYDEEASRLDALLGTRCSLLVDHMPRAEATTADAVRAILGRSREALPDAAALDLLLDPAKNRYRLETLQLAVHSPLTRALHHPCYTFLKRLSHTADSQDQRHRMVPASRPMMAFTDTRRPDYVVPSLVAANASAQEVFTRAMQAAWAAKNQLLDLGTPLELALYVLPNAKALRFHETGNLLYLGQKWVQRTCLNAQEEIYQASMDELEQVRAVHPQLAAFLGPPCVLRAGRVTPVCTEGQHFCGIPVWRTFPRVERKI